MILHDYQQSGIAEIEHLWTAGKTRVLAVGPTGAGKGTMAVELMVRATQAGQRVLFIVHLREIAEDIANRLRGRGLLRVGMILPGHERDPSAPVQVATVQSLLGSALTHCDLVVIDEAHHYRATEWEAVLKNAPRARFVGFTATPQRSDGKGLGQIFDSLVPIVSYGSLRERGVIVPMRLFVPATRIDGVAMCPADAYLKYGEGRSAFVFLRDLGTAQTVQEKLAARGVRAAIVTDKTPHKTRAKAVSELRVVTRIDWRLSDANIAKNSGGEHTGTIAALRRLIKPKSFNAGRKTKIDWEALPLSQMSVKELARVTGLTYAAVSIALKKKKLSPSKKPHVCAKCGVAGHNARTCIRERSL